MHEYHYLSGRVHNENGPASIAYYENGNIEYEDYYLNDERINFNSIEEFKKYVKTLILK